MLITDRDDWTIAEVIIAYRSQWEVQADFRQVKDHDYVAEAPMLHWTDQKIAVHLFSCVLALSVLRILTRDAHRAGLSMSTGEIMRELADLHQTVLVHPSTGRLPLARRAHRNDSHLGLFEVLKLEAFAPRS